VVSPEQQRASADVPPFAAIARSPNFDAKQLAYFLLNASENARLASEPDRGGRHRSIYRDFEKLEHLDLGGAFRRSTYLRISSGSIDFPPRSRTTKQASCPSTDTSSRTSSFHHQSRPLRSARLAQEAEGAGGRLKTATQFQPKKYLGERPAGVFFVWSVAKTGLRYATAERGKRLPA
jgi:hypothetical protein